MSLQIHDKGLSTIVGGSKSRMSEDLLQAYSLRKWQQRIRVSDATERNLAVALSELAKLCAALRLPKNILETASVIYRRAIRKRLVRGRSIQNVTAAAIYMSCRQSGVPRTLDEIAAIAIVDKKKIGRDFRFLMRFLDEKVPASNHRSYTARLANQLRISGRTEGIAMKILELARENRLTSGRGPQGLSASAVYLACVINNEHKTQRVISTAAGVTEVTLRNRGRELLAKMIVLVPL